MKLSDKKQYIAIKYYHRPLGLHFLGTGRFFKSTTALTLNFTASISLTVNLKKRGICMEIDISLKRKHSM